MEMCLVGAELFHADVQTDVMKLLVAFRNFPNSCNIAQFGFCIVAFVWMC